MGRSKKNQSEAAPVNQPAVADEVKTETSKPVTYVVVRDGFRVSDKEYGVANDPAAVTERDFWKKVAKKHSYGEKVEIVQYEPRKHRVW